MGICPAITIPSYLVYFCFPLWGKKCSGRDLGPRPSGQHRENDPKSFSPSAKTSAQERGTNPQLPAWLEQLLQLWESQKIPILLPFPRLSVVPSMGVCPTCWEKCGFPTGKCLKHLWQAAGGKLDTAFWTSLIFYFPDILNLLNPP